MADLGEKIRSALDKFDMEEARVLLRNALKEPTADIYYLASLAALNETQRENFLNQAVELDPFHREATEALGKLGQKEQPTRQDSSIEPVASTRSTSPVQASNSKPVNATTESKSDQPALVTGSVSDESRSTLFQIPSTSGAERTFMSKESEIILLTRDEKADWYNIVYTASTGQQLLGWVEAKDIHDVSLLGNPIEIMDLPITQFEWNTREDIDDLINISKAKMPIPPAAILSIITGIMISGFCFFTSLGNFDFFSLLFVIVGLGLIVFGIVKIRNRSEANSESSVSTINRLKKIKASKKPDSQKLMENQLITAAIQTGMNVGSTIITKLVPDKQVITHRNK